MQQKLEGLVTKEKTKILEVTVTKEILKLKSKYKTLLLTLSLLGIGILGRAIFQEIPSVEPLTSLVVLTGFLFGPVYGFFSGAVGFYESNYFVWGGQGIWTIFQSLGAGLAGFIAGIVGKTVKKKISYLVSVILGIIVYETIVTIPMAIIFNPLNPFFYIITSLPFSFIHLTSSAGFALVFYSFIDKLDNWRFEEIERKTIVIRNRIGTPFYNCTKLYFFRKKK